MSGGTDVTDGGHWRRPSMPPAPGAPEAAWWSDASSDPWRDPYSAAAIHLPPPAPSGGPPLEVVPDPDAPRRPWSPILLICLVTALLAGGVGGTLGFVFAVRGGYATGGGTQLGAAPQAAGAVQHAPESTAGVVDQVLPSVVTVRVSGAIGSGFVVSTDGYVITNDHVVAGADGAMSVSFSDGSTASAKLVGRDPESDVAVIKVAKSGLTPVGLGDSDTIAVGDPVLAFGSPLALVNTVTQGIVSALDRPIVQSGGDSSGVTRYYAAIQTDAAVNQGNSGGPLVDASGQVVGVNSVIRSVGASDTEAGNIGLAFAIPINQAKRVAQDIIDTGKARRTVIGAEVMTGGSYSGARLRAVEPAGPAAAAALKSGDVVTRLDGHLLDDGTDLIALVRKYAPGSVVAVEYRRGNKTASASVTLAADTN
ncbi:trypsin-like peptidase domain-containing protein [Actinoplanes sp. NBRC 101535]|uniref:S1C family serine protease n=1 Tax=Actinoplanes sp. NBRC 101535 TaxID=3032196 RepID=UPI0025556A92|nr:trypsin-like peptidase domain-containing protein [Actinoplanes sp. NBRC 101535]